MTQKIIRGRRVPALPGVAWPLLGLITQGDQPISFCVGSKKPLTHCLEWPSTIQTRKRGCQMPGLNVEDTRHRTCRHL